MSTPSLTKLIIKRYGCLSYLFCKARQLLYQIMKKWHNCGVRHFWTCQEGLQSTTLCLYGRIKNTGSGPCSSAFLLGGLCHGFLHWVRKHCSHKVKSHAQGLKGKWHFGQTAKTEKDENHQTIWHGCLIPRNTENNPFITAVVLCAKAPDLLLKGHVISTRSMFIMTGCGHLRIFNNTMTWPSTSHSSSSPIQWRMMCLTRDS